MNFYQRLEKNPGIWKKMGKYEYVYRDGCVYKRRRTLEWEAEGFSKRCYANEKKLYPEFDIAIELPRARDITNKMLFHFGITGIEVRFILRSGGGKSSYRNKYILYGLDGALLSTIAHEVAHQVADNRNGKRMKHTLGFQETRDEVFEYARKYLL